MYPYGRRGKKRRSTLLLSVEIISDKKLVLKIELYTVKEIKLTIEFVAKMKN